MENSKRVVGHTQGPSGQGRVLRDVFVCIDAKPDCLLCMNEDRLFAVSALNGPANMQVHEVPCLLLLALAPHAGRIVMDGPVTCLARTLRPGGRQLVADWLERAAARGVIDSAEGLLAYLDTLPADHDAGDKLRQLAGMLSSSGARDANGARTTNPEQEGVSP